MVTWNKEHEATNATDDDDEVTTFLHHPYFSTTTPPISTQGSGQIQSSYLLLSATAIWNGIGTEGEEDWFCGVTRSSCEQAQHHVCRVSSGLCVACCCLLSLSLDTLESSRACGRFSIWVSSVQVKEDDRPSSFYEFLRWYFEIEI